jgi:antitoxin HigA-1
MKQSIRRQSRNSHVMVPKWPVAGPSWPSNSSVLRVCCRAAQGAERIGPVTPGEVLREEFMVPLGLSGRALARELGVPSNRITEIVAGGRAISAETAILLGDRFGTSAEFWLNLQMARDLEQAKSAASSRNPDLTSANRHSPGLR